MTDYVVWRKWPGEDGWDFDSVQQTELAAKLRASVLFGQGAVITIKQEPEDEKGAVAA